MQEWSAAFPAEMKENHCQPHLSITRQEKACSNSTWLISCKFFKGLKRALSTWKVWLISSILQFTTAQLINKMLAHLVRRSNLSTGMNTKSLVLMRCLIRAVPWKTARMLWSLIKANYWSVNVSDTLLLWYYLISGRYRTCRDVHNFADAHRYRRRNLLRIVRQRAFTHFKT